MESLAGLSRWRLLLLASSAGITVANLYYSQPNLAIIASSLHVTGRVGLIPMSTQLGYAVGLIAVVPLSDRFDRKNLILILCGVLTIATAAAALARNLPQIVIASVFVGIGSTTTQMLIALAAELSPPERRGRAVGVVLSGALMGILLARVISGAIGDALGWKAVFRYASVTALSLGTLLCFVLPSVRTKVDHSYFDLLKSLAKLWAEYRTLRLSCLIQSLLFAVFSGFWSVLALLLQGPPYSLGPKVAGSFGLVGVLGAGAASIGGRLADRYGPRFGVLTGVGIVAVSFAVWSLFAGLPALIVVTILLESGLCLAQVSNQFTVLSLSEHARNRINTIYVTTYFIGGALGSGISAGIWQREGRMGVSMLNLAIACLALVICLLTHSAPAEPSGA